MSNLPCTAEQVRLQLNMTKDEFESDEDIRDTINLMIEEADACISSECGETYDRSDCKARRLALLLIYDWYNDRSLYETKGSGQFKRAVQILKLNLKFETIRKLRNSV